jgi:hypothetical protein
MASVAKADDSDFSRLLVPFFEDMRTLAEKLHVEDRQWRQHQPNQKCPELIAGLVPAKIREQADEGLVRLRANSHGRLLSRGARRSLGRYQPACGLSGT